MEAMRILHTMITQMMTQFLGMQNTQTAQAQTITELQQQWNAQHNELHRDIRTMQQARYHLTVLHIGRGHPSGMDDLLLTVDANMTLQPKILLIALPSLVHFGVAFALLVLGG